MTASVGSLRAAWLLTRLRLRRQLNQVVSVYRHRMGAKTRKGTPRKSSTMWVLSGLFGVAMLFGIVNFAAQSVANLDRAARVSQPQAATQTTSRRASTARLPDGATGRQAAQSSPSASQSPSSPVPSPAPSLSPSRLPSIPSGSVLSSAMLRGTTFIATLGLIAVLFLTVASREIARPEWDLEWLATLPLPTTTLIGSRIAERALTNFTAILILAPILAVIAWRCGYRWTAPLLGIGLTIPLMFLVATVQTLIDTGLRLSLAPSRLRNLHAVISVVSPLPLLLVTSMNLPDNTLVFGWALATPDWAGWLPGGLAVRALAATDGWVAAQWFGLMAAEAAVMTAIGFVVLVRQLRNGVVGAGVREAARRASPAPPVAASGGGWASTLLSPVQRRELRLLGRDRSFMAQTLVLPVMMVVVQLVLNVHSNVFVGAIQAPANLAAIAFGLAAYTLMFSAFQTLNAEGQALWILYCVPQSLESILRQKALMWAAVATVYALGVLAIAVVVARDISLPFVGAAAVVLAGVPIFSVIATALGVFGCDPLEQDVQKRVSATYLYLYMVLASFYAYAAYASSIWQCAALMVLTALVALALWQKARDRFVYLLDPSASPPARVSVSDGLIAALMFFVLQALVGLIEIGTSGHTLTAPMLWIAFSVAGAITYGVMRLIYWRAGTAGVPRVFAKGLPVAALWGLGGGIAAALGGLGYIWLVRAMDWFPALRQGNIFSDPVTALWLAALAVVAAPIFEEFIFRGLIFGGLRRSLGFGAAGVASAAIFAIVHPPVSVVPVFVLGLCTALIYERTRMLAAPMIVHAVYNAAVIGFQWNLMHQSV
jgi:membrane protease YdiL (CAAX protease family)